MKEFMRKFNLVCDWYAETPLDFEDELVFKFNIDSINDTLEEHHLKSIRALLHPPN